MWTLKSESIFDDFIITVLNVRVRHFVNQIWVQCFALITIIFVISLPVLLMSGLVTKFVATHYLQVIQIPTFGILVVQLPTTVFTTLGLIMTTGAQVCWVFVVL